MSSLVEFFDSGEMTFPVWIDIGVGRIHPHLAFELLAYLVSATAYWHLRRQDGDHLSTEDRWALAASAIVGAVGGSRLLYWLEDPQRTVATMTDVLRVLGGQTVVGGLIGGWIAVEWQKRRMGLVEPTGDLYAIPIALGTAVGRIGCFLSGLEDGTYGIATTLPWGVDLGDGLARHPTALYESAFFFMLAACLLRAGRSLRRGESFLALMLAYVSFRIVVDFLKPGVPFAGLTAIQWAAVGALVMCVRVWVKRRGAADVPLLAKSGNTIQD